MSESEHRAFDPIDEHEAADRFEELIRHRAFELSQGAEAGAEEENWLRAEREVRAHAGHRPVWDDDLADVRDEEESILVDAEI